MPEGTTAFVTVVGCVRHPAIPNMIYTQFIPLINMLPPLNATTESLNRHCLSALFRRRIDSNAIRNKLLENEPPFTYFKRITQVTIFNGHKL